MNKDKLTVNVLIVGDSGVGKTALLVRFCDDEFNSSSISTVGIDCKAKEIKQDGKSVKVQIWDTAGQERYGKLASTYYKKANGIILAYDVNDRKSFSNVKGWIKQIETNANEQVIKFLVGNKIDLSNRVVSISEGKKLAGSHGMIFAETSAKEKYGVVETFEELVKEIKKSIVQKNNEVNGSQNPAQTNQEGESNGEEMAMQQSARIRLSTVNMHKNEKKEKEKGCCN